MLRDANRTLQLKLRDSEVANDDFERQARNTSSSLEDMESKHNMAVERAVLLEEEIKIGELEREQLRIETQRLKEELSEVRIEAELLQDKIRNHESNRHFSPISTDTSVFDGSNHSAASSPFITTPIDLKSPVSESIPGSLELLTDPPSPPMSDASISFPRASNAHAPVRRARMQSMDEHAVPTPRRRPVVTAGRAPGTRSGVTGSALLRTPATAAGASSSLATTGRTPYTASNKTPGSNSLSHIRNLTAQMQRLEDRVHRARSKLPGPLSTPPDMSLSPRNSIGPSGFSSIRPHKRGETSTAVSVTSDESASTHASTMHAAAPSGRHVPRLSTSGVSRLSFGPLPNRGSDISASRPGSRASGASSVRPESRTSLTRSPSRTNFSTCTRTPLRPQSSLSGSLHHNHNHKILASDSNRRVDDDVVAEDPPTLRTPNRRSTLSARLGKSSRPPLSSSGIPTPGRRTSSVSVPATGATLGPTSRPTSAMALRPPSAASRRPLDDLGETY